MGWRSFTIRDIADSSGSPTDWTSLGSYYITDLGGAYFRLSGHFSVNGYGWSAVQFRVQDVTGGVTLAYINQAAYTATGGYRSYYLVHEGTTPISSGYHEIQIQYMRSVAGVTTYWKNLQLEYRY